PYRDYKSNSGEVQHFFITCLCLERSERNDKNDDTIRKILYLAAANFFIPSPTGYNLFVLTIY
ncbi:hypothetical protein, partial [Enterocloster bolteae]|uniref:hypothetical protein n=1 Tax=Enterocloster bolteae TaxID=208479 RepID=UPI002900025C